MTAAAALVKILSEEQGRRSSIAAPTPRPAQVRLATEADEQKLFDLLMLLAAENAMDPVSDTKVMDMIRHATRREGGVIGIIDAPDGSIAATVGITMAQWWYSNAWRCEEAWSFVHPDHRGGNGRYAKQLIQFSKWWGEQLGMPVLMGVLSTHRTLGKIRLYARNIPVVGALFLHRAGSV